MELAANSLTAILSVINARMSGYKVIIYVLVSSCRSKVEFQQTIPIPLITILI